MKKLISLVLAVLMFCALCVPALAEETKTAEDYMNEAAQLESVGDYMNAAIAYNNAAIAYGMLGDYFSVCDALLKAGSCSSKAELWNDAGTAFDEAANTYSKTLGDHASAVEARMRAARIYINAGIWNKAGKSLAAAASSYKALGDPVNAGEAYMRAGECYMKAGELSNAASHFDKAAIIYKDNNMPSSAAGAYYVKAYVYRQDGNNSNADCWVSIANDLMQQCLGGGSTASTLSEGNMTIVLCVACSAVFLAVGFFLGRKKKPAK